MRVRRKAAKFYPWSAIMVCYLIVNDKKLTLRSGSGLCFTLAMAYTHAVVRNEFEGRYLCGGGLVNTMSSTEPRGSRYMGKMGLSSM